jgi:hypothetical protein
MSNVFNIDPAVVVGFSSFSAYHRGTANITIPLLAELSSG